MKLLNTLLFALTISAMPMMETSADVSMSMTAPRPSLFRMNQTTQNVLTGIGIGVGALVIGYCLYQYFRPRTDQEFAQQVRGELTAIGTQTLSLPEAESTNGLVDDINLMASPSNFVTTDFLSNDVLQSQLVTFGRSAKLVNGQYWRATDENRLSDWCAEQAPLLRAQAIVNDNIQLLEKRRNELTNRSTLHPTGACQNPALARDINTLLTKLQRISYAFTSGITKTYNGIYDAYAVKLDEKRKAEEVLRIERLKAAAQLELAAATQERNDIERQKLVRPAHQNS